MKLDPDLNREDRLLQAVLGGEAWQTDQATLKAQVLGVFHARQRQRRLLRRAGVAGCLLAALACVLHWASPPGSTPPRSLAGNGPGPGTATKSVRFLTDQELLASFPPNTCFLAEIDGRKELVFLDANAERQYLARRRAF